MFRLLALEVVHWDYWQRFTVPLEASIVTIVGPNGSGKTTLLDALRTLLALDCSKKRDYKRYARKNSEEFCWLRGVVDNSRSPAGGHPFFPILTGKVTLACRIEKKGGDWARQYCIAEGETAIEQLQENGVWMGVREYQRRLHDAGLTPAITQVLSLEQGQTDKLCELTPKALLDLVFQVFGDKQALERYQEAREHHLATERELKEIDGQLARLGLQIERLTEQVNRYIQWREINQERARLVSEIRPRLEYMQLLDSIRGARSQLTGARREWRAKRAEQTALERRLPLLEAAIATAGAELARVRENEQADIVALNAVSKEVGRLEQLLRERERLTRLATEAGASDPEAAQKRLGEAERDRAQVATELTQLHRDLIENKELLALLEAGSRADPPDVGALRSALDGAGITHDTLPEIVELLDEGWQAAVEAALAPLKHIVLLRRDEDRAAAWAIGEKLRYRHFIVPERAEPSAPTPGSLLEVVRFTRPAPLWLMQTLDRTQRVEDAETGAQLPRGQDWITRIGYLRERRGGRYAGQKPADWHFGRARLTALKETLAELLGRISGLETQKTALSGVIDRERAAAMGIDASRALAARAEEFVQAESDLQAACERAQASGATLASVQTERESCNDRLNTARTERNDAMRVSADLARAIHDIELNLKREDQVSRILRLRHDRALMPANWRDRDANLALQALYETPSAVEREIQRIEKRLETEEWITDENVVALRDKLREDYNRQSAEQQRRALENERARDLTDRAREKYIDVLRATVRNYGRNLKALGEIAGVVVESVPPQLANDDVTLAQAGLEVKFDFDRKGFIGMNDGDASGGQQVMKSLILLIALMMEESRPGGFVFIDEPFAHLDIFNIDRVANFLRATKAQYLITTPITHNLNVYDPSMLTLVTFKKKPGEAWAPTIGKLVRQKDDGN